MSRTPHQYPGRPRPPIVSPEAFIVFVTLLMATSAGLARTRATVTASATAHLAAAVGAPSLIISEVFADPLLQDDRAGEFVEVANVGDRPASLAAVRLVLPSGKVLGLARAGDRRLAVGAVLVLRPMGNHPDGHHLPGLKLPNRAGRLELRWRDVVLDVAQWTGKWPWPKHRVGWSLERRGPGADGRVGRGWRHCRVAYHGVERASPGRLPRGWSLPPGGK